LIINEKKRREPLLKYNENKTIKKRFCGDRDHEKSPLKGRRLHTRKTTQSQQKTKILKHTMHLNSSYNRKIDYISIFLYKKKSGS
jgi:sulfate adenylyltransferase subunit 1 (EFTu-like GTPase family)